MSNLLDALNWRYAVKKFDPTKKISAADFSELKEVLRLSTSSYGLQLYKFLVIKDEETRAKLKEASWGQGQLVDASEVVVFCIPSSFEESQINEYLDLVVETRNIPAESVKGYGDFMKGTLLTKDQAALENWMARQTYIALGNLLDAAAIKEIDACPMEGFDPAKYDEILGLKAKGLKAVLVTTLGYRSEEDATQNYPKVRKSEEVLFEEV